LLEFGALGKTVLEYVTIEATAPTQARNSFSKKTVLPPKNQRQTTKA
jgi:hypothetical protein